jgi:hypothetical protein
MIGLTLKYHNLKDNFLSKLYAIYQFMHPFGAFEHFGQRHRAFAWSVGAKSGHGVFCVFLVIFEAFLSRILAPQVSKH